MQLNRNGQPSYWYVFMLLILMLLPAMVGNWSLESLTASGVLYLIFGLFCSLVAGPIHRTYSVHKPVFYIPLWPIVLVIGLFHFLRIARYAMWPNRIRR